MKTRAQFLAAHRHELAGLLLDGATAGRRGSELSLWLNGVMGRIDAILGAVYDDVNPPTPGVNGTPGKPPAAATPPTAQPTGVKR